MPLQREVEPRIARLALAVRENLAAGQSIDDVLAFLKRHESGSSFFAIAVLWKALNLELLDARELVETSAVFNPDHFRLHAHRRSWLLQRIGPNGGEGPPP